MNKLVYSALALTLLSVPGMAADNGWSGLDKELENLQSSMAQDSSSGPKIGGYLITSYRYSGDVNVPFDTDGDGVPDNNDLSGVQIDSARIEIKGSPGSDYKYKISFDVGGGTAVIKDAYAEWKIVDGVNGKFGRFKQPFSRSQLLGDNKLVFLDRTAIGTLTGRDQGFMVFGNFDTVNWYVAGQNGLDGQGDNYLLTGRVAATVMGKGVDEVEGAYGAGKDTNLLVAAAIADEGSIDKGLHWIVEAALTAGPFSVAGELADFDKGNGATAGWGKVNPIAGNDIADTTPWDITATYLITQQYEVAGRYEDADDDDNSTRWVAAVNRYTQGHDIKWQLQYASIQSDVDAIERDEVALGLTVSF